MWNLFLSSSPQPPVDLVSVSLACQLARRHECQGGHQQGGVRAPRREDAGCRDGEAEDKEENPLFGHRRSGRLHDLHLPLRLESPVAFSFGFVRVVFHRRDAGHISSHTFQHFPLNFTLNALADERANISPADGSTNCKLDLLLGFRSIFFKWV